MHASEDCNATVSAVLVPAKSVWDASDVLLPEAGSIISMPLIPAGHSWSGGLFSRKLPFSDFLKASFYAVSLHLLILVAHGVYHDASCAGECVRSSDVILCVVTKIH